ncbi:hypothetical protein C8Q76DRAFT_810782, partial [Earliella scabrosa]
NHHSPETKSDVAEASYTPARGLNLISLQRLTFMNDLAPHWPLYGLSIARDFPTDQFEPTQSTRAAIAARRTALQYELLALGALHNATLPMNLLPNEILIEILSVIQSDGIVPGGPCYCDGEARRLASLHWVPLMGVCRHWRAVACCTPQLWSTIDVYGGLDWLKLCLTRAVDTNIKLSIHYYYSGLEPLLPLLIPVADRISTIIWPNIDNDDLRSILSFFDRSMPNLEAMGVLRAFPPDTTDAGEGPLDLTITRFPSLRVLHLAGVAIPWTPVVLSQLTFLELSDCFHMSPRIDRPALLDALASCQCLVELKLRQFLSVVTAEVSPIPNRIISLPKLRKLVLEDASDHILIMTSCLDLPLDVVIDLVPILMIVPANLSFRDMFPQDCCHIPITSSAHYAQVAVCRDHMVLCAGTRPRLDDPLSSNLSIRYECEEWFEETDYSTLFGRGLESFMVLFAESAIENLTLYGDGDQVTADLWQRLFEQFPRLHTITINLDRDGDSVQCIFTALTTVPSSESIPVVCPNLRCLSVIGKATYKAGDIEEVERCLQFRATHNAAPLDKLELGILHERKQRFRRVRLKEIFDSVSPEGVLEI